MLATHPVGRFAHGHIGQFQSRPCIVMCGQEVSFARRRVFTCHAAIQDQRRALDIDGSSFIPTIVIERAGVDRSSCLPNVDGSTSLTINLRVVPRRRELKRRMSGKFEDHLRTTYSISNVALECAVVDLHGSTGSINSSALKVACSPARN